MYDTLIAFHILDLIQKSLERISFRFSDISCPDDFLLSESGMMKLDSICMKLTAIGESIKNLDKVTNKELLAQYPEIPWIRSKLVWKMAHSSSPDIFSSIMRMSLSKNRFV